MKLRLAAWPLVLIPIFALLTVKRDPAVREIFTSEQLFVTKLTPVKSRSKKGQKKFEAKLRAAFKVIKYQGDTSYVELDWTLCPNGQCPEMGQFEEGSSGYEKIGSLIKSVQK
ncbi:MAG TPA: hypothetical protein VKB19_15910 [Pedobacter sp.]|nr:hypothetical protein [Pedobacter sp.]